jgi:hypothetical protein
LLNSGHSFLGPSSFTPPPPLSLAYCENISLLFSIKVLDFLSSCNNFRAMYVSEFSGNWTLEW